MATHSERMLPILKKSAINNNINLEIFGGGKKWKNYGNKLSEIIKYISDIPDNEIIFFVDAYDTLILAPENIILERYNNLNNSIEDKNKKDLIFSNGRNFIKYMPSLLLEINSGLFIGKSKKMKGVFNNIKNKYTLDNEGSCDVILEDFKDYLYIDNNYELFYNYYFDGFLQRIFTKQENIKNIKVANKKLIIYENNKNTYPIAIHFPKNSMNKKLIRQLGYNYTENMENSVNYVLKDYFKHYHEYIVKYIILVVLILFIIKKLII